jgi:hypothetical protein
MDDFSKLLSLHNRTVTSSTTTTNYYSNNKRQRQSNNKIDKQGNDNEQSSATTTTTAAPTESTTTTSSDFNTTTTPLTNPTNPSTTTTNQITPRILVIIPAGPNSLHFKWDLSSIQTTVLMWYGPDNVEIPPNMLLNINLVIRKRGPKWQLVRHALNALPAWDKEYDYIFLPDDDVEWETGSIPLLAQTMYVHGLQLAQPCLKDENITSPAYRPIVTRSQVTGAILHLTNFVEIMVPMFDVNALAMLFPLMIDRDETQSGWGMDRVWPHLLPERTVGVVDICQIHHTRPPQAFKMNTSYQDGVLDPRMEELNLLVRFKVDPLERKRVWDVIVEHQPTTTSHHRNHHRNNVRTQQQQQSYHNNNYSTNNSQYYYYS